MLSLLFFIAVRPQDDPVARFEKFIRGATSLKVDMGLKVSGVPHVGKGYFQTKRPDHLLFVMKWGPSDFSFSAAGDEVVAIEKSNKVYREYGAVGRLFAPEGDISATPEYAFPMPLLAGSIRVLLPNGSRFIAAGKGMVDKVPVDLVRAQFATPTSRVSIHAKIDAKGRLLECVTTYGDGPSAQVRTLSFRNYVLNQPLPNASFLTPVPRGYVPRTLPADSFPVDVGEKMPLEGWKAISGSGDLRAIAQNKVLFIAIGEPDCEVSARSARTIANLAKEISAKGGAAVAICPAPSAPEPIYTTLPNFYDPTGKLFRKLRTPGTPTFFLVSPRGNITRVWYGFDEAQASEFVKDALEWVDPKKGG